MRKQDRKLGENRLSKMAITSRDPELHPRVLKEISSSITKPLYHIFKQSLDKGKLPSD
jgi:hypothetical protein